MLLTSHVDLLRSDLLSEFAEDMSTCLIATTPERLQAHARTYGWERRALENVAASDAIVIQKPGRLPHLWIRWGVRAHRRLYLAFLQQCIDASIREIGTEWQVDHLQASHRFTAGHPIYFIRLALVARRVNASYGAGFEKAFYSRERDKPPSGGFHMDWLAMLKSQGVRLPGKAAGVMRWQQWAWLIATWLEKTADQDRVLTYHGLTTMLNLGYCGKFAPLQVLPEHQALARGYPSWDCCPGLG